MISRIFTWLTVCILWLGALSARADIVKIGDLTLTNQLSPLMSGSDPIGSVPPQSLLKIEQLKGGWFLTTWETNGQRIRGWVAVKDVSLVRLVKAESPTESTPASDPKPTPMPTPTPAASTEPKADAVAELEAAVHKLVNQHRQKLGLKPFVLDERISHISRQHSQSMAAGTTPFGHDGVEGRFQALSKLIPNQSSSENVAWTSAGFADPAATAFDGWLKSDGHRASIEGAYQLTGIGAARSSQGEFYFTQMFLRTE